MLRGVIFDIDGTLLESNGAHARSWVETLAAAGYEIPYDVIWPMIGMGADKLLPAAAGIESDSPLGKELTKNAGRYFARSISLRCVQHLVRASSPNE